MAKVVSHTHQFEVGGGGGGGGGGGERSNGGGAGRAVQIVPTFCVQNQKILQILIILQVPVHSVEEWVASVLLATQSQLTYGLFSPS